MSRKNSSALSDDDTMMMDGSQNPEMPVFFLTRAIGWFAVAIVICAITFFAVNTELFTIGKVMPAATVVAVICVVHGVRIFLIGKTGKYFTIRLECVAVHALNIIENFPSYINPASNTAFRGGQQVTFQSQSGAKVIFTFDRSRKFLVGAQYDFYFRNAMKDEKLTPEVLERLKIDHSIVSEEFMQTTDFSNDVHNKS